MLKDWFDDPANQSFTCYGLGLSPLCVGHLFLLREFESPYFQDGLHTEADLRIAALICSAPWSEARRFTINRSNGFFRVTWKCLTALHDFDRENEAFIRYLGSHFKGISTKTKVSVAGMTPDTYASPMEWILLGSLIKHCHFTPNEAMDFPVWKALRLEAVIGELDGRVEIVTDDLMALFDLVERERVNDGRTTPESSPQYQG